MTKSTLKTKRCKKTERGAALVETAIVLIPLCLIVFGIIEYGFIFKDSLTLSNATRSGARTASAEPGGPTFYQDTVDAVSRGASGLVMSGGEKLFIYKARPDGLPESGSDTSCTTNCAEYTWNGGSKRFVLNQNNWPVANHQACFGSADSVGVILRINHDALSGFFKDMPLRERTVMRFEPVSSDC